jgi:hypothetical protein
MSKFLSLSWFKSKVEQAVEKVITNKIETLMEQEDDNDVPGSDFDIDRKPYLNVKLVNDVLTIVLLDGKVLVKSNATYQDFIAAKNATTEEELLLIVVCAEVRQEQISRAHEANKIRAIQQGLSLLKANPEFEVKDNTAYFKGINRSIPNVLLEELLRVVNTCNERQTLLSEDEEYLSLKRFFMWCCLNPRAEVADELYRFLKENSFRITKQGFFVALRNVVTLHGSPELVHFISNAYNKVKAVWKKNPDQYYVYLNNNEYKLVHIDHLTKTEEIKSTVCTECDGTGELWDYSDDDAGDSEYNVLECQMCNGTGEVEEYKYTIEVPIDNGKYIGVLTELYLDLPNRAENRFTDDWTETFDIRIGKPVSMPTEECNWSTQDCAAAGLHFTADQIHYVGCGDQSVLVLINPMKVVGIGQHKGRCYEYLPIMTVPREEATTILHDLQFDTLQLDESFAIRELENLEELAKQGFATESKKYDFNLPQISSIEIKAIVTSLQEMKAELETRIINID